MRLIDLFDQNILNELPKGAAEQKAIGVTADSRQVSAGMIFVAIKGHTHDGHAFIQDAIKNGAVAVVSEEAVSTADALVIHVENSRLMLSQLAKAFTPGQPSIIAAPMAKLRLRISCVKSGSKSAGGAPPSARLGCAARILMT
jgi:UDP-N-acetylmuramyl pentapeptide synthase